MFLVTWRTRQSLGIQHSSQGRGLNQQLHACCGFCHGSVLEKQSRKFSSSYHIARGSRSVAVKRKSYGNKVFQCLLKNPKKQLKMRGKNNLYNDLKKWMCSEKAPFKSL